MKLNVKSGPFIKSNVTKQKIELTILISLIIMNLYRILVDGILPIFYLVSVFVPLFISSVIYDSISKRQIRLLNYINVIISSLITTLLIPINSNYILILILTFVTGIIGKFLKVNEISLNLSLILIFNNPTMTNYNIYIFSLLLILSIVALIKNRALKFRISLIYILVLILSFILKSIDINRIFMLLLIGVYVIPYFKSSPNTSTVQYMYGLILGIIGAFANYNVLYISITLLSIVFIYIDFYNSYLLSRK